MVDDPYAVLGVQKDADDAVIDAAYQALAEKTNPDHDGGDPAEFDRIHEAYKQIFESNTTPASNTDPGQKFSEWAKAQK